MRGDPACREWPARRACLAVLGAGLVPVGWRAPLAVLPWLAACSPTFDWREVRCADGAVRCLLPAKPAEMSRRIFLRDVEVDMQMIGAQADGLSFTVASLANAPRLRAEADALLDAMREQMLRNVKAPPDAGTRVGIPVLDAAGRRMQPREGVELDTRADPMRMKARFFLANGKPTQAVVLGARMDDDAARQFLDSVTIHGA